MFWKGAYFSHTPKQGSALIFHARKPIINPATPKARARMMNLSRWLPEASISNVVTVATCALLLAGVQLEEEYLVLILVGLCIAMF